MPTYEYNCDACGHAFEQFQSITAAPIKKCPQCKKNKVRRLIGTGAGLIFKGSGFYITDYRNDSYKKAAEKDAGGAAPAEKKSDTPAKSDAPAAAAPAPRTESKPAKKSDSTGKPGA